MNRIIKFLQYLILFLIGGSIYYLTETIYKGLTSGKSSHFSMFIVGGVLLILIGLINEFEPFKKLSIIKQMFISSIMITLVEYLSGIYLNIYLKLGIWDYKKLPLNVNGQICLPFTLIWFFFSIIPILLDDFIREKIFKEKLHTHKLF